MTTKTVMLLAVVLGAAQARATDAPLDPDSVLSRLQVKGEVFVLDPTGTRLLGSSSHSSLWTTSGQHGSRSLDSHWGNSSDVAGSIFLDLTWTVREDGSMVVDLEQFAREEDHGAGHRHEFADSLRKQRIELKDFAPVLWESATPPPGRKVVVRLTPSLGDPAATPLERLPLAATEASLFDNQGHAWADHLSFEGVYVGVASMEGTLALSFYPFAGGEPIGTAEGRRLSVLLPDQRKVTLMSETPFLPGQARATVFAKFYPERKSEGPHSVHLMDTDKEDKFLRKLEQ